MGAVLSLALGLAPERPAPRAIMAFSGFLPPVLAWEPAPRGGLPKVFLSHGRRDEVIAVEHARDAVERLRAAGVEVEYSESDATHRVDPRELPAAAAWLGRALP
jgi:predicted esterase